MGGGGGGGDDRDVAKLRDFKKIYFSFFLSGSDILIFIFFSPCLSNTKRMMCAREKNKNVSLIVYVHAVCVSPSAHAKGQGTLGTPGVSPRRGSLQLIT